MQLKNANVLWHVIPGLAAIDTVLAINIPCNELNFKPRGQYMTDNPLCPYRSRLLY